MQNMRCWRAVRMPLYLWLEICHFIFLCLHLQSKTIHAFTQMCVRACVCLCARACGLLAGLGSITDFVSSPIHSFIHRLRLIPDWSCSIILSDGKNQNYPHLGNARLTSILLLLCVCVVLVVCNEYWLGASVVVLALRAPAAAAAAPGVKTRSRDPYMCPSLYIYLKYMFINILQHDDERPKPFAGTMPQNNSTSINCFDHTSMYGWCPTFFLWFGDFLGTHCDVLNACTLRRSHLFLLFFNFKRQEYKHYVYLQLFFVQGWPLILHAYIECSLCL